MKRLILAIMVFLFIPLIGCLPEDSSADNPYFVQVIGFVTDNGTVYGSSAVTTNTITNITGVLIGNGTTIAYVALPSGVLVGTTESQTLTGKTLTSPIINGTITTIGLTIDAGSGYLKIDSTGRVGLVTDGGISSGGVAYNCLQNYFGGAFQSGGVSNHAAKFYMDGELIGFENDNAALALARFSGSIKTQDSADDVIGVVCTLYLGEPSITKQGSTQVTVAATLYIDEAPGEGVTNAAIYVVNGITDVLHLRVRGSLYGDLELMEMVAPGAGAANRVRVYVVEDGGGLTDLCAVFQDGTVDIFAQETTRLDAPQFEYSSGTKVEMEMRKPHPGLIQYGYVFPDGRFQVEREIEYHDAGKIAANKGCDGPLPVDWIVTTLEQRVADNIAKIEALLVAETDLFEIERLEGLKSLELERLKVEK